MKDFQEIRKLFGIDGDAHGVGEAEIELGERALGRRLPETLRRYHLQLGRHEKLNQTQDSLISPAQLEADAGGFVVFYCENQSVWSAALNLADFALDDPTVYLFYNQAEPPYEIGGPSNFLTAEAFLQALFALPFAANRSGVDPATAALVKRRWRPAAAISYLWGTTFYRNADDEMLALITGEEQTDLYIAARDERRFRAIIETLGIDWDYNTLADG